MTLDFLKKYLNLAKRTKPVLTQKAAGRISDEYARLRNQDQESTELARVSGWPNYLLLTLTVKIEYTRLL